MIQLFTNLALSTLAAPIGPGNTTIQLAVGGGALFPSPGADEYFVLSLTDNATRILSEVTICTARTGDVLTVVRGQEGTTAQSWAVGDVAYNPITEGTMENFSQRYQTQLQADNYAVDTGTANALVIALTYPPENFSVLTGAPIRVKKGAAANTGPVTLAVNGFTATPIVYANGAPLSGGELPSHSVFQVISDGTEFVLPISGGPGGGPGGRGTITEIDTTLPVTGGPITNTGTIGLTIPLPVVDGGTGQIAYTDGQLLVGDSGTGGLDVNTLTAGPGIGITNASGSITITNTSPGGGSNTAIFRIDGIYDATSSPFPIVAASPGDPTKQSIVYDPSGSCSIVNTGGTFGSAYVFTAPVTGYYQLNLNASLLIDGPPAADTLYAGEFYFNVGGSFNAHGFSQVNVTGSSATAQLNDQEMTANLGLVVHLSLGNFVFFVWSNEPPSPPSTGYATLAITQFSGFLISAG